MSYECFSSSDQRAKMISNMLSGNPDSRVSFLLLDCSNVMELDR